MKRICVRDESGARGSSYVWETLKVGLFLRFWSLVKMCAESRTAENGSYCSTQGTN